MNALWLMRLVVGAAMLALPFFGVSSGQTSLLGRSLATVSAQTSGPASPQEVGNEDELPIVDEDVNDQGSGDEHGPETDNEAEH